MILLKPGVDFHFLTKQFYREFLPAVEETWQCLGVKPVITSAFDGKHKPDSLHYQGYAWDLRTHNLTPMEKETALSMLRRKLGPDYDVILEPTHIHVEYDPEDPRFAQKHA